MPEVVVVGAGVVGCAVARELAPAVDVAVLDRGAVGGGTTARSAGLVTMTPAYSDEPAVAAHANAFFEGREEFVPRESLELVPSQREGEARRRVERLADAGLDVTFLDAERVREAHPRLAADGWCGAVRHAEAGYADAVALTESLATEAAERGAELETGTTVTDLCVTDDAVTGVETDEETRPADAVVVAAGWRTPELLDDRLSLPVRPYRTQCAVFRPDDPLPDGFPVGAVPEERVYFRPAADGALLVGGWAHAVDDPERASRESDAAFREHAGEVAAGLVGESDRVDEWAGVDCGTPDARPVVGAPAVGPSGLVVATGFHGRGVMTAPVAATAVRSLLTDEPAPFPLELFRRDRFDDPSPAFEFFSIPEER